MSTTPSGIVIDLKKSQRPTAARRDVRDLDPVLVMRAFCPIEPDPLARALWAEPGVNTRFVTVLSWFFTETINDRWGFTNFAAFDRPRDFCVPAYVPPVRA